MQPIKRRLAGDWASRAAKIFGAYLNAYPILKPHIYIYIYGAYLGAYPLCRACFRTILVNLKIAGHVYKKVTRIDFSA